MKTQQLIHNAFNRFKSVKNENEYNPSVKVQSTVEPLKKASFNEIAINLHKQIQEL